MLSRKPYLLHAMYQWITDSGRTPYIVVDTQVAGVQAPAGYAQGGKLVLNVSETATRGLDLGNNRQLDFETRFGGMSRHVSVPLDAVLAIYAQETGQGIVFGPEEEPTPGGTPPAETGTSPKRAGSRKPSLKVVK